MQLSFAMTAVNFRGAVRPIAKFEGRSVSAHRGIRADSSKAFLDVIGTCGGNYFACCNS